MSRVKGKNTKPEKIVRRMLWHSGYRYQVQCKDLPGKPDIVFRGKKKVIFIHGCFWHKHDCSKFSWPKTNIKFWKEKISRNVIRDRENIKVLVEKGWDVLVVWECEIAVTNLEKTTSIIVNFLGKK